LDGIYGFEFLLGAGRYLSSEDTPACGSLNFSCPFIALSRIVHRGSFVRMDEFISGAMILLSRSTQEDP